MGKFNIVKKINLLPVLGEGHEQSYISFKPMTFKDAKRIQKLQSTEDFTPELPQEPAEGASAGEVAKYEAAVKKAVKEAETRENDAALASLDKIIEFLQGKFVEGKIADVDVAKADFENDELGADVINYCVQQLATGGKSEGFTKP